MVGVHQTQFLPGNGPSYCSQRGWSKLSWYSGEFGPFITSVAYSRDIQSEGDLWYFPPGVPHSLQATADLPEGAEFLLVCCNAIG